MLAKSGIFRIIIFAFIGVLGIIRLSSFAAGIAANAGVLLTMQSLLPLDSAIPEFPSALLLSSDAPTGLSAPAEVLLGISIRMIPNHDSAHRYLGLLSLRTGRWVEATQHLQGVLIDNPYPGLAHYWLGFVRMRAGNQAEAINEWVASGAGGGLLEIAESLNRENSQDTRSWYEQAILVTEQSFPPREDILGRSYHRLGEMARSQGDLNAAIRHFEQALTALPERSDYRYDLAELYSRTGNYSAAIRHLRPELQRNPENLPACGLLGEVYLLDGDSQLAEKLLLECQSIAGDNYWHGRVAHALSKVYCQSAHWATCIHYAIQAMRLLGAGASWVTEYPAYFYAALQAEPDNRNYYLKIGDAYQAVNMLSEARAYLEQAARRWPDDSMIIDRLNSINE